MIRLDAVTRELLHHRRTHCFGNIRLGPSEHGGPCSRNRTTERACGERGIAHRSEPGDQLPALRLDDDVVQTLTDQLEIVGIATGNKAGEVSADAVKEARDKTSLRSTPYGEAELMQPL